MSFSEGVATFYYEQNDCSGDPLFGVGVDLKQSAISYKINQCTPVLSASTRTLCLADGQISQETFSTSSSCSGNPTLTVNVPKCTLKLGITCKLPAAAATMARLDIYNNTCGLKSLDTYYGSAFFPNGKCSSFNGVTGFFKVTVTGNTMKLETFSSNLCDNTPTASFNYEMGVCSNGSPVPGRREMSQVLESFGIQAGSSVEFGGIGNSAASFVLSFGLIAAVIVALVF